MKLLYKNYIPKIAVAILFVFAGQLFQSCSKNKAEDEVPGDTRLDGKISVKVLGIDEDDDVAVINPKGNVASKSVARETGTTPRKTIIYPGFDAVVSVERDVLKQPNIAIGNVPKGISSTSDLLAVSAMATNVKYRLLLYKTDGTFVSSTPLVSGTAGAVDVAKGTAYNWYAISYNNTDDVPDVADHANPTLALPGGKDALYASGSITIPANGPDGNSPLGITFKHSLARIAVELNTMGMFADINTAAVAVSGIVVKTGTINLKTGALSNLVNYTQTVNYASFSDVLAPYHDAKVAYIYTADAVTPAALTVTLTNLALDIDNGTVRSFATLLGTTPSVFTFNVTPQLGKSYRALVNLVESPLTLAGVRWARANLYNPGGHNPYRFHHTYAATNQRNSYFSFKGIVSADYGTNGDPCSLVYPAGIWRQASEPDFRTLVGGALGIGAQPLTPGTAGGIRYLEYNNSTGTVAPYPSNKLHFNYNGEGVGLALVAGIIQLNFNGTYGASAQVWTGTAGIDLLGLIGVGAWDYSGNTGILGTSGALGVSLLNVSAIGLDVIKTNFKNVRCVRTAI
ncbi:fimbrillin family protein [Pedobacter antarcticus]|uniref:fimbrillin family protein n=1 Tax=Pedobacter antarcticus TaxID=34086 RepID=UPI001C57EB09|nr:fimbrillin family protein [Pedobacter antarcticus]